MWFIRRFPVREPCHVPDLGKHPSRDDGPDPGQAGQRPVDGLYPLAGEFVASVDNHAQSIQFRIRGQHPYLLRADCGDSHAVGVMGVALTTVSGVEQPNPGCKLRWYIDHVLAVGDQPLGQRSAGTVAALDGPGRPRPPGHVVQHRLVADLVGGEASRPEQPLVLVDDLDRC